MSKQQVKATTISINKKIESIKKSLVELEDMNLLMSKRENNRHIIKCWSELNLLKEEIL